jgi:16S rRNA (guanine527-N7)-methyltransferase
VSEQLVEEITAAIQTAGLAELPAEAVEKLAVYLELLSKWNSKLNLTAVRGTTEMIQRHLLECVQCAQALPEVTTLLDFGSGAGLPGIPIAILRPEIRVTLGESQGKKASFLREAIRVLEVKAEVFDGRIETMAPERVFDGVTLRAVDRMAEACAAGLERVRIGGHLVLFATLATEKSLGLTGMPVEWESRQQIFALKTGVLLIGRKL